MAGGRRGKDDGKQKITSGPLVQSIGNGYYSFTFSFAETSFQELTTMDGASTHYV